MTAARAALEAADPSLVLHWVRSEDEADVRAAFQHTMEGRALGPEARALADRYFFETLVRIHRAAEGAPYTGLTDGEPDPIIAATDRALASGSADEVEQQLITTVKAGLAERFSAAHMKKSFRRGDVAGGRAFVAAYVSLTHWVEAVLSTAKGTGEHHATGDHAAPAHPIVHEHDGAPTTGITAETHVGGELAHLPWILTGFLAIAALVEAVFLVRRRRHATPV